MERLTRHPGQQLLGRSAVHQLTWAPDRGVLAEAERGQVREPGDVVEMEVREQDVEPRGPAQELGVLDDPCHAGSGVDHDRGVALTKQRASRVATVTGEPAAAAQDPQHLLRA